MKKTTNSRQVSCSAENPHIIHPTAVYTAEQVRRLLGLRPSTLQTAKREQGLRCCRRAGHDYYLGEDLLAWLKGGRCSRGGADQVEGMPCINPRIKRAENRKTERKAKEG